MKNQEDAKKLVQTLKKIKNRYNSILFSKLILFEQEQSSIQRVRHYDIECEAATNIADLLLTKIKRIQFRTLHMIKDYARTKQQTKRPIHSATQRSIRDVRSVYQNSPKNSFSSRNIRKSPTSEYYNSRQDLYERESNYTTVRRNNMRGQLQQVDYSMQALMEKVKNLTQKFSKNRQPEPSNQYQYKYQQSVQRNHNNSRNYDRYSDVDQLPPSKQQKRRQILMKLNKLESDLTSFISNDNDSSYRRNHYETHSNMSRAYDRDISRETYDREATRYNRREQMQRGNGGYQKFESNQIKYRPSGTEYYNRKDVYENRGNGRREQAERATKYW